MLSSSKIFASTVIRVTSRRFSSFPSHVVVGMPSLSPTMTAGTIGKWNVKVGDKISPGDALAEVETDKASVTFEAQDDFIIAKLLVDAGAEVKVGDPILVTVEDAANIAAFANFAVAVAAPVAPAPVTPPKSVPTPTPAVPVPAPVTPPKPTPVATAQVSTPVPAAVAPKVPTQPPVAIPVRNIADSPLASILSSQQNAYIQRFGRCGQSPIDSGKKEKK